jgi:hypothetical protein
MKRVRGGRLSVSLVVCSFFFTPLYAQEAPADSEQQKILGAIKAYSENYVSRLPNFVCQQVTQEFQADSKGKHWRKADALSEKLVYSDGRERRTLELVNNKPLKAGRMRLRRPLSTEGEFGLLLSRIFDEGSDAKFAWDGWDTIRGHRVAKFNYTIDREHSSMSLTSYIKATVAYGGSIFGEPETGAVWRVTSGSAEIPEALQMKSIATTVNYDQVPIGSQTYLLPIDATVLVVADHDQTRNEMNFTGYQKFEAESTITFGPGNDADKKPSSPPPQ